MNLYKNINRNITYSFQNLLNIFFNLYSPSFINSYLTKIYYLSFKFKSYYESFISFIFVFISKKITYFLLYFPFYSLKFHFNNLKCKLFIYFYLY